MSLHSDTLYWFRANQSLLLFLNAAYLAEKQQIQILAFGLTWSGLEPTIYRTRGEQSNHYTTDVVRDMIWRYELNSQKYMQTFKNSTILELITEDLTPLTSKSTPWHLKKIK